MCLGARNATTDQPWSESCGTGEFACGPGAKRRCIVRSWVCDRVDDCGNGRDEDPEICGQCITAK